MLANDGLRGRARGSSVEEEEAEETEEMPTISRIVPRDEELGKRDDNYRPSKKQTTWESWRTPLRWRRKRIALVIAGLVLVYIFIHNIPTDLGSIDQRMGRPPRGQAAIGNRPGARGGATGQEPSGAPPGPPRGDDPASDPLQHYFGGPIKFYKLANSLHQIMRTNGHRPNNKNVLFAASSLKSAANLIPMACEMARVDKNYVHLVLLGRAAIPLEEVMEINGVSDKEDCNVYFHDGRPDYSEYSSDIRAEVSVAGAMNHVNTYMHPQVVIMDDSAVEDIFFVRAMRGKMNELDKPIIEIPKGKYEDFLWMTKLDLGSLAAWHRPTLDILVHVPPGSSGSLMRLLQSLTEADYAGFTRPRLTIEMPAVVDSTLQEYIRNLQWPPSESDGRPQQNMLKVHRRIPSNRASSEANAVRFLESFYPAKAADSHVLVLSAQTELSPLYYHYLMYHLLRFPYSSWDPDASRLLGIGLAVPSTSLDGKKPFVLPKMEGMKRDHYKTSAEDSFLKSPAPFAWQAPNADAILIFGDKWVEIHDYLTNRLRALHTPGSVDLALTKKHKKAVSETQPAWMEFMLELVKARGWSTLIPAQSESGRWATVHNELYKLPEEFRRPTPSTKDNDAAVTAAPESEEAFLLGAESPVAARQVEKPVMQHTQPLLQLLPFDGTLADLGHLPLLAESGEQIVDQLTSDMMAKAYRGILRERVGGCEYAEAIRLRVSSAGKTDDLFCFVDVERSYEEGYEETEPDVVVGEDGDGRDGMAAKVKAAEIVGTETRAVSVTKTREGSVMTTTAASRAVGRVGKIEVVDVPAVEPEVREDIDTQ